MDKVRGILMIAVGAFVIYRGMLMLGNRSAWVAISLGIVAIALGVYRLARKPPQRLM
jgi:hypothetical protein